MTRALAAEATPIHLGTCILAEVEAHSARARFAVDLDCVRPSFSTAEARSVPSGIAGVLDEPAKMGLSVKGARHPLLELRMRRDHRTRLVEAGRIQRRRQSLLR